MRGQTKLLGVVAEAISFQTYLQIKDVHGQSVENAYISIRSGEYTFEGASDADGIIQGYALPNVVSELYVYKVGFSSVLVKFILVNSAEVIDFKDNTLLLAIYDRKNRPVHQAKVTLTTQEGTQEFQTGFNGVLEAKYTRGVTNALKIEYPDFPVYRSFIPSFSKEGQTFDSPYIMVPVINLDGIVE